MTANKIITEYKENKAVMVAAIIKTRMISINYNKYVKLTYMMFTQL